MAGAGGGSAGNGDAGSMSSAAGTAGGSISAAGAAGAAGSGGAASAPTTRCQTLSFSTPPQVESDERVCADFAFNHTYNEGPTWVQSQNAFFFTNFVIFDGTAGDIIKYVPGAGCEIFIEDVGCNGLAVSNDGNLLAACHKSRSIIQFDIETKEPTTLASSYMGDMLDTPNDVVMHSNGTIYFTNPNYELDGRPPGVGQAVFRIDPSRTLHLVDQPSRCNGIGLTPDETKLYVLQAGMWDLDAQGLPGDRRDLFVSGDGMAVDCAGNLYASDGIFSATGERLAEFDSGTNLAFGGADGRTLLVVGRNSVVRELRMSIPGLP